MSKKLTRKQTAEILLNMEDDVVLDLWGFAKNDIKQVDSAYVLQCDGKTIALRGRTLFSDKQVLINIASNIIRNNIDSNSKNFYDRDQDIPTELLNYTPKAVSSTTLKMFGRKRGELESSSPKVSNLTARAIFDTLIAKEILKIKKI